MAADYSDSERVMKNISSTQKDYQAVIVTSYPVLKYIYYKH